MFGNCPLAPLFVRVRILASSRAWLGYFTCSWSRFVKAVAFATAEGRSPCATAGDEVTCCRRPVSWSPCITHAVPGVAFRKAVRSPSVFDATVCVPNRTGSAFWREKLNALQCDVLLSALTRLMFCFSSSYRLIYKLRCKTRKEIKIMFNLLRMKRKQLKSLLNLFSQISVFASLWAP